MAGPLLKVEISPPIRDLQGRFARLEGEAAVVRREELRELGRKYIAIAQEEAPKRTGAFARSIRYRTTAETGKRMALSVTMATPLGNYIVFGTHAHIIVPVRAQALHFYTKGGNEVFTRRVRHPGTSPNPFQQRAMKRLEPEIDMALRRIGLRFVKVMTG